MDAATSTEPDAGHRSQLHVSVSQIKEYVRCPRLYFLHRVRGVEPAFMPVALAFGSAFHAALSFFYGMIKATGIAPALDAMTEVFLDAWRNSGDGPLPLQAEDEEADVIDHEAKGAAMVAAFYDHSASVPVDVVAVERGFSVTLHDPDTGEQLEETLVGAFDLVLREDDRHVVVEHKTSKRKFSLDQLRYDHQVTAYKRAAAQLGLGVVGVRFQVITKATRPVMQIVDVERDAQDEDDFMRTVVGVLRAIDAGAFYPIRGWQCRGCQYAHACEGGGR